MSPRPWDCVVVGAGPAGLSAAIYMGRFRRRTLLLDDARGRWSYGQVNDNYLGFPGGIGARRLHELGRRQAHRFGVTIRSGTVTGIVREEDVYVLQAGRDTIRSRTVIWATGVEDHWPEFPMVRRLVGRRLFWCIVCDGWRASEKEVLILGNTNAAAATTLQFLVYTRRVTLLVDPDKKRMASRSRAKLIEAGVALLSGRVAAARLGDDRLEVRLSGGSRLRPHLIFSLLGHTPRTELLRDLGIRLSVRGHVRVDDKNKTTLPGFFSAGDVTDKHAHQVVTAAHEGAAAALAANHLLYPPWQRLSK